MTTDLLPHLSGALPGWATGPETAFAIGAIGLIASLVGIYLTIRANRESARNLSHLRKLIIDGVADVVATKRPKTSKAQSSPPLLPPRIQSKPESTKGQEGGPPETAGDLQAGIGEYAGAAMLTNAGDADLLVEQVMDGQTTLKVFSWSDFDLVLVAEAANNTGAHFCVVDPPPSSIATLDIRDGKLVERKLTWQGKGFEERVNPRPVDLNQFLQAPAWIS